MTSSIPHFAAIALLGLGCATQAAVITFDPIDEQGATVAQGDSFQAQGFTFTQRNGDPAILFAADLTGAYASNGTASLYAANNAMFSITGGPTGIFSIGSIELGGGNLGFLDPFYGGEPWATDVLLLGTLADNSTLTASFSLDQTSAGLAPFAVNWTNLVDLKFSAIGDYSVDNLQLNAVPEPGSLALVLGALGAMTALARRRQRGAG